MSGISEVLVLLGLLGAGVVYGTDVFFAVVGRPALEEVGEASVAEVMGRLHCYGDAHMPLFGIPGLVSTAGLVFTAGLGSAASGWALLALVGLLTQLGAYLFVAKPVNAMLATVAAATPTDARGLQRRWDSVIVLRALGTATGVLGLGLAALAL